MSLHFYPRPTNSSQLFHSFVSLSFTEFKLFPQCKTLALETIAPCSLRCHDPVNTQRLKDGRKQSRWNLVSDFMTRTSLLELRQTHTSPQLMGFISQSLLQIAVHKILPFILFSFWSWRLNQGPDTNQACTPALNCTCWPLKIQQDVSHIVLYVYCDLFISLESRPNS